MTFALCSYMGTASHLQLSGNVGLMSNEAFELASISKFAAVLKEVRYESCTVVLGYDYSQLAI